MIIVAEGLTVVHLIREEAATPDTVNMTMKRNIAAIREIRKKIELMMTVRKETTVTIKTAMLSAAKIGFTRTGIETAIAHTVVKKKTTVTVIAKDTAIEIET